MSARGTPADARRAVAAGVPTTSSRPEPGRRHRPRAEVVTSTKPTRLADLGLNGPPAEFVRC